MTRTVRISLNRVLLLCCECARGDRDAKLELVRLLRGDHRLTANEQRYLADYIEGKFNPRRGRPEDPWRQGDFERMADAVKAAKRKYQFPHEKAIEFVIKEEGYREDRRSEVENTLKNYISRSKKRGKVAQ